MAKKKQRVEAVEGRLLDELKKLTSREFVYEDGWCGMVPFNGKLGEMQTGPPVPFGELSWRQQVREWYTTEEFARAVNKADFTIREYCRLSRLRAEKRQSGRGKHAQWVLAHSELERYRRNGLLPVQRPA